MRILGTPVCQDDVACRIGNRPFLREPPFVPGYSMIGIVDSEDWSALFHLLAENKIQPIVAETFPLLEAARANEMLESGQVVGNVVLLAPEMFQLPSLCDRPSNDEKSQASSLASTHIV